MSDQPISDLRRRMLQDMAVRQFGEKTQHDYIRHVEAFARFLGRSPETVTVDDLRRFQFQQIADGAQPPKMNTQASALRFFLSITLGRGDLARQCRCPTRHIAGKADASAPEAPVRRCPCCGSRMLVIESFEGCRSVYFPLTEGSDYAPQARPPVLR